VLGNLRALWSCGIGEEFLDQLFLGPIKLFMINLSGHHKQSLDDEGGGSVLSSQLFTMKQTETEYTFHESPHNLSPLSLSVVIGLEGDFELSVLGVGHDM
jgi:hypothetical protein